MMDSVGFKYAKEYEDNSNSGQSFAYLNVLLYRLKILLLDDKYLHADIEVKCTVIDSLYKDCGRIAKVNSGRITGVILKNNAGMVKDAYATSPEIETIFIPDRHFVKLPLRTICSAMSSIFVDYSAKLEGGSNNSVDDLEGTEHPELLFSKLIKKNSSSYTNMPEISDVRYAPRGMKDPKLINWFSPYNKETPNVYIEEAERLYREYRIKYDEKKRNARNKNCRLNPFRDDVIEYKQRKKEVCPYSYIGNDETYHSEEHKDEGYSYQSNPSKTVRGVKAKSNSRTVTKASKTASNTVKRKPRSASPKLTLDLLNKKMECTTKKVEEQLKKSEDKINKTLDLLLEKINNTYSNINTIHDQKSNG